MNIKASPVIDQKSLIQEGECWPAANWRAKAKPDPSRRTLPSELLSSFGISGNAANFTRGACVLVGQAQGPVIQELSNYKKATNL